MKFVQNNQLYLAVYFIAYHYLKLSSAANVTLFLVILGLIIRSKSYFVLNLIRTKKYQDIFELFPGSVIPY